MMKVLIIEDEVMAAERLQELIMAAYPETKVLARIESISKAVKWFNENETPDLAFFDIQLADGLSFEIFEKTSVECPVIFTTAYDEYALKAFKVNSVDYLLKPIDAAELGSALEKYHTLHKTPDTLPDQSANIDKVLRLLSKQYKSRFVVRVGEHIRSIHLDDVICFYSMARATYIQTTENRNYVIDHSLDQLEELLDPEKFYRVNRKFFIRLEAIDDIISYTNSRLKVKLTQPTEEEIIVAREKVKGFKQWLEQ